MVQDCKNTNTKIVEFDYIPCIQLEKKKWVKAYHIIPWLAFDETRSWGFFLNWWCLDTMNILFFEFQHTSFKIVLAKQDVKLSGGTKTSCEILLISEGDAHS